MELLTDADLGIQTAPEPASSEPSRATPPAVLTVRPAPRPASMLSTSSAEGSDGQPPAHDGVTSAPPGRFTDADLGIGGTKPGPALLSDADVGIGQDTPHPGGVLSNAPDDGYPSGALKGLGTAGSGRRCRLGRA